MIVELDIPSGFLIQDAKKVVILSPDKDSFRSYFKHNAAIAVEDNVCCIIEVDDFKYFIPPYRVERSSVTVNYFRYHLGSWEKLLEDWVKEGKNGGSS